MNPREKSSTGFAVNELHGFREYTEGMNDMDLYTNGGGRSVQFIIRPKQ